MFSQSCYFVQNNKQSSLTGSIGLHHNFSLLASSYTRISKTFAYLQSNSVPNFEDVRFDFTKTTMNPFDIRLSSCNNMKINLSNVGFNSNVSHMQQRMKCKEVLEISSLPLSSATLVRRFVNSKSQLNYYFTQRFHVSMWDIIKSLGVVDLNANNSNISKQNIFGPYSSDSGSELENLMINSGIQNTGHSLTAEKITNNVSELNETQGIVLKKQSYPDVAEINSPTIPSKNCKIYLSDCPNAVKFGPIRNDNEYGRNSNFRLESSSSEVETAEIFVPSEEISANDRSLMDSKGSIKNNEKGEINCESLKVPLLKSILKTTPKKTEQLEEEAESSSCLDLPRVSCVQSRDRFVSQCSDDSECSFIVFEEQSDDDSSSVNTDGDEVSEDDDTSDSSCDDSDEDSLQTLEVSCRVLEG